MATTQAALTDIDVPEPEHNDAVPRWLENPAAIEAGARILVDRNDHRLDRAYTVTEARSNSLVAERDGSTVELRKRGGEWFHAGTSFGSTVRLVATAEKPVLRCDRCGDGTDPANFARRDGNEYTCAGCDE